MLRRLSRDQRLLLPTRRYTPPDRPRSLLAHPLAPSCKPQVVISIFATGWRWRDRIKAGADRGKPLRHGASLDLGTTVGQDHRHGRAGYQGGRSRQDGTRHHHRNRHRLKRCQWAYKSFQGLSAALDGRQGLRPSPAQPPAVAASGLGFERVVTPSAIPSF